MLFKLSLLAATLTAVSATIQVNYYSDDACGNYIGTYEQQGNELSCTCVGGGIGSILCLDTQETDSDCTYQQVDGYSDSGCSAGQNVVVGCGSDYECVSTLGKDVLGFAWLNVDDCGEARIVTGGSKE